MHGVHEIAAQFVKIALRYGKHWPKIEGLPGNELQVLLDAVSAAGFYPKKIAFGQLLERKKDSEGNLEKEARPINCFCHFKIIDGEDNNDYNATGWLDCALQRIVFGLKNREESPKDKVRVMIELIKQNIPLKPIRLTSNGDYLVEYEQQKQIYGLKYFILHVHDDTPLIIPRVGTHKDCGGTMHHKPKSRHYNEICCTKCQLSVPIPKKVKTYGGVRSHISRER